MKLDAFLHLDQDQLVIVSGGFTPPAVKQLWAAGEAKRWNEAYRSTIDKARFHQVSPYSLNSLAVEHADYVTGQSRFPAPAVPYVTVGPGAVR